MELKKFYETNEDFKTYVDASMRVSFKDRTLDEFLGLALTREVAESYANKAKGKSENSTYGKVGECE